MEYRINELWLDPDTKKVWINIGFFLPLCCVPEDFQKTLAVSGYTYADYFDHISKECKQKFDFIYNYNDN